MRVDAAEGVVSEDARTWISELEKRSVIGIPLLCWKLCWLSGQFAGVFLQNELPNILLSGIKSIQIFQMIEHFIHDGLHSFCFCIRFKIIQFQTMYVIQYFENLNSCHHCRNFLSSIWPYFLLLYYVLLKRISLSLCKQFCPGGMKSHNLLPRKVF